MDTKVEETQIQVSASGSGVEVEVRFPHRRYHATPWDSTASDGVAEWPPSPWRVLRALLAVWHNKAGRLDEAVVESLITKLSSLPRYHLPKATRHHTRHFMPTPEYQSLHNRVTQNTLSPQLVLLSDAVVKIQWPSTSLTVEEREVLEHLLSKLTYLGRSESVCVATLSDSTSVVDETWTVPETVAAELCKDKTPTGHRVSVMCAGVGATREQLELSPYDMRRRKLTYPPGARFVNYVVPGDGTVARVAPVVVRPPRQQVSAFRFRVNGSVPVYGRRGVLLTEALRNAVFKAVTLEATTSTSEPKTKGRLEDRVENVLLHGHVAMADESVAEIVRSHGCAHWLWLSKPDNGEVTDLVLWIPALENVDASPTAALQLKDEELAAISRVFSGGMGTTSGGRPMNQIAGWDPHGGQDDEAESSSGHYNDPLSKLPSVMAELVGRGRADDVLPRLCRSAHRWVSVTPYLPERFRKKGRDDDLVEFLQRDVERACAVRGLGVPRVSVVNDAEMPQGRRGVSKYRRYRRNQSMKASRHGHWVSVEFDDSVSGPLSLGHLSHFGFGLFEPQDD